MVTKTSNKKKTTTKKKPVRKASKKPAKKAVKKKVSADKKYADGTTYKDSEGKTHKRVSYPGTKRGKAYCARSDGQPRTDKVKARRKAWGCSGKTSRKK